MPSVVKNNSCVWVLATKRVVTTSSSLVGHADNALAAAFLGAEIGQSGAFDVAARGDGHDHVFAFDQVFVVHVAGPVDDLGAARHGELIAHFAQLVRR